MAEIDYQRLNDLAAIEGKTPSGFALDIIKTVLLSRRPISSKPFKTVSEPLNDQKRAQVPVTAKKPAIEPLNHLTRQQRRALERQSKKGVK